MTPHFLCRMSHCLLSFRFWVIKTLNFSSDQSGWQPGAAQIRDCNVNVFVNLFEDVSVSDVAVVDLQYGRQQLEKVVDVLPFLLHEQIAVVADHSLLQVLADLAVFLPRRTANTHAPVKPGFHYPSWRLELTGRVDGRAFPLAELTGRVNGPPTRLVETRARQHGSLSSIKWYRRKLRAKQALHATHSPVSADLQLRLRSAPPYGPLWLGKDFSF